MKLLLGIVIAVLMTIVVSERPSVALDPMNWSAVTDLYGPVYQFATSKDLLVYSEYVSPTLKRGSSLGQRVMNIRRRDSEGAYVSVGTYTDYPALFATTNGKWVIIFSKGLVLFNIDSDNVISDSSFINSLGGYVLSDDTFVGYDPVSETQDGNYTIRSYQYESSNNTWINIPGTELIVTTTVSTSGDSASYRATDTHVVFADTTNSEDIHVKIYERQANKSWKFIESVPVNNSFVDDYDISVNYNGVDTVTFAYTGVQTEGNGTGILFVYTKSSNGSWTEQTFTTTSVGYRPQGYFGTVTNFVDTNTLLVTAALEGFDLQVDGEPTNAGKVLVMTRNANGGWEPSFDLGHPASEGLFGLALGVNDYDIIVPNFIFDSNLEALSLTFYSAPRCVLQPINVTCNDQQVNDCSQLNVSSLYTVNSQCGDITATLNGLSLVNNKAVEATFSFTNGGLSTSCTSTVTCPAPPVVAQPPSSTSVSGAGALKFGLATLFLAAAMLM